MASGIARAAASAVASLRVRFLNGLPLGMRDVLLAVRCGGMWGDDVELNQWERSHHRLLDDEVSRVEGKPRVHEGVAGPTVRPLYTTPTGAAHLALWFAADQWERVHTCPLPPHRGFRTCDDQRAPR